MVAHTFVERLRHVARAVGEAGLTLLFPPVCAGCGRVGEAFCAHCAQEVEAAPATPSAPYPGAPLLFARAAALHSAPLRQAIHAFKYERQPELAPLLARYLVATYAAPPWSTLATRITAVVPVPLHPARLAARGYNQAQLLAECFGRVVGLPVQPTWLARIRETRQQVGLGPRARQANVADAFVADPAVAGTHLLLVDDVYTTGATLRACAAAAQRAGARAVYGLTLAQPAHQPVPPHAPPWYAGSEVDTPDLPWWEGDI